MLILFTFQACRLSDVSRVRISDCIKERDLLQRAAGKIVNGLMMCLAKHFYHVRGLWVLLLTMAITANKTKTQFVFSLLDSREQLLLCRASKMERHRVAHIL